MLYALTLTWCMLAPASAFEAVGQLFPHQDKVAHGLLFLALGALARWSFPVPGGGRFAGFAALLLYAAAIESLQPLLGGEGRRFDWLDMGCNAAGAVSGWLLCGRAAGYHAGVGFTTASNQGRAVR